MTRSQAYDVILLAPLWWINVAFASYCLLMAVADSIHPLGRLVLLLGYLGLTGNALVVRHSIQEVAP